MKKFLFLVCMLGVANVYAASALFSTNIVRTGASPGVNGGCVFRIDVSPASQGLSCSDTRFVSADCDGGFGSKADGSLLFNQGFASMLVSTKPASLLVTDSQTYGNMCVVKRVDVQK